MSKADWSSYLANVHNMDSLQRSLDESLAKKNGVWIVTVNLDVLRQLEGDLDSDFQKSIQENVIRTADGFPIRYLSSWLSKNKCERVTGVEIANVLIDLGIQNSIPVVLSGGKDNDAVIAANNVRSKNPNAQVSGIILPYGDSNLLTEMISNELSSFTREDRFILLLGAGSIKSEKVIYNLIGQFPKAIFISCGAAIAYLSGSRKSPPKIISKLNLEWLWRLSIEPVRLFRRYLIHDLRFLISIISEVFFLKRKSCVVNEQNNAK
jgi:N-acetylglucosaminyldiphosphoundecaprenol N-acetyl-beta-D-mannosaminyltransferase